MARKTRVCSTPDCSNIFTATNLYCRKCRTQDRVCANEECRRPFRHDGSTFCSRCRYPERMCATDGCENIYKASNRYCSACREIRRTCATPDCENTYVGNALHCRPCLTPWRTCTTLGCLVEFRGTQRRCWNCRAVARKCTGEGCTNEYRGTNILCTACQTIERVCSVKKCGAIYWGERRQCPDCRKSERLCADCGRSFLGRTTLCSPCWWQQLPETVRAAVQRARGNARRARKLAAEVAGPLSQAEYILIRNESACVYCGQVATEIDHIRPLTRGGWEHSENLVPACRSCNASKGSKLLTEWDPRRVFRAVTKSTKVALEYQRQLSGSADIHPVRVTRIADTNR
jgi:hypothetical protein